MYIHTHSHTHTLNIKDVHKTSKLQSPCRGRLDYYLPTQKKKQTKKITDYDNELQQMGRLQFGDLGGM